MTDAEYREAKRGVAVPYFFKRKIFMVCMMLVCSGIMAVAATYAWFILSTAPEVSGISTTVGANGSLEIALLNNETGVDPTQIRAEVGDSITIVGAVQGNVTWGNLVDVSDKDYGLQTIVMYPAVLNAAGDTLNTSAMLSIPHNGVDGRITSVSSNTAPAVYNGTAFTTTGANYGVRAIGSVGSGSNREANLSAAKSSFQASQSSALTTAQRAVKNYGAALFSVAMNGSSASYTVEQVTALKNMATELGNALNYIMTAYKQAIIANAAANSRLSDSDFEAIRTGIATATGNTLSIYAAQYPSGVSAADLNALDNSISSANAAVDLTNRLLYSNYGTDEQEPVPDSTTYAYAQVSGIIAKIADPTNLSFSNLTADSLILSAAAGKGLITDVADYVGNYEAPVESLIVKATTTNCEGKGLLSAIDLSGLSAPASAPSTSTNNTTVTNFYGYVIDLAFRTNAAADLQLQTAAVDRVYTDGAGATAGKGSCVTYTFPATMTDTQVTSMLSAVRVVFFDPDSGTMFATAKLGSPTINRTSSATSGEGGVKMATATAELSLVGEGTKLVELEVAVPKKLSALVYLDGTMLSNLSVVNAQDSGSLLMNFQFSSSADLKPMVDTELKNSTG